MSDLQSECTAFNHTFAGIATLHWIGGETAPIQVYTRLIKQSLPT